MEIDAIAPAAFKTGDPLDLWQNAPAEWSQDTLWNLANYINGSAFKPSDFTPDGLHIIKITELKYGVSADTALYSGPYQQKHLLRTGDLLFAWSGNPETSLDAFRWRNGDALLNQHIFRVLPRDGIDKTYFYFLLKFLRPTFIRTARDKATSMGHVKVSDLKRLIAWIPPLDEQRVIAGVLGALDDKIELNRRTNETLEALAQTLFREWFGDLGASAPLPELIEVNPPRLLRKGEVAPYLDMANMPTHSARALEVYDREFGSGMRFMNGDTLVARITPCLENGKTCFVDFLGDGEVGWGSTEYIVLSPKPPLPPEYAYFLARTEQFRAFAISNMTGTSGRQRVPADCFEHFQIAAPPADTTERFGQFARSVFAKMKANDDESRTLAALRDTLLPKLLSGAVRVKAA